MRAFIAIEIPEQIRKKIDSFVQEEKKRNLPIKWVKFQNLHITLKFLGEVDEQRKKEIMPVITEISRKYTSFHIQFQGIGCFPSPKNPRVLWIGIAAGNKVLCDITEELEEEFSHLGFKREKRFHAHLTIGRTKKFCKVDDILEKNITLEPFSVSEITLFKSTLKPEGPIYEALQKFKLG